MSVTLPDPNRRGQFFKPFKPMTTNKRKDVFSPRIQRKKPRSGGKPKSRVFCVRLEIPPGVPEEVVMQHILNAVKGVNVFKPETVSIKRKTPLYSDQGSVK